MRFDQRLKELRSEKDITQRELAKALNVASSTVAMYELGQRTPDAEMLHRLASFFNCSIDYLLGHSNNRHPLPPGAWEAGPMTKVPILGTIRAGEPILVDELIEGWEIAEAERVKDGQYFYLRVTGDSMIGSRIHDGDLVLVRQQEEVENGEIAVVNVDGENATLKRIYHTNGELVLQPDNPKYPPIVIKSGNVRICGKVVEVTFKP